MSKDEYTTGEIARLCGVTVRTVQYYDAKGLLAPSATTEGGNRLYSDADVAELRFICLLKSLGLGLAQIRGVLESPNRAEVTRLLLEEQRATLEEEASETRRRLEALDALSADIDLTGDVNIRSEADMARHMQDGRSRKAWVAKMVALGVVADAASIGGLAYAIVAGGWWAFACGLVAACAIAAAMTVGYWRHVTYLCPACGCEFRPKTTQWVFAGHTPKTRRLDCPCCGTKDWCVERWHAELVTGQPKERIG